MLDGKPEVGASYVPGFWSVKGFIETVWTLILAMITDAENREYGNSNTRSFQLQRITIE